MIEGWLYETGTLLRMVRPWFTPTDRSKRWIKAHQTYGQVWTCRICGNRLVGETHRPYHLGKHAHHQVTLWDRGRVDIGL